MAVFGPWVKRCPPTWRRHIQQYEPAGANPPPTQYELVRQAPQSGLCPMRWLTASENSVPIPTSPALRTGTTGVCAPTAAKGAASKNPMHPPRIPGRTSGRLMSPRVFESLTARHTPIKPPKTAPIKSPAWLTDLPSIDARTAEKPVKPVTKKKSITRFKRKSSQQRPQIRHRWSASRLFLVGDLVRWQKRQCCKRRRCVRHEHPPPGFAVLAPMFMIIIERIRPPAFPAALIDLPFTLIGLQSQFMALLRLGWPEGNPARRSA